jgi:hypothetical protein
MATLSTFAASSILALFSLLTVSIGTGCAASTADDESVGAEESAYSRGVTTGASEYKCVLGGSAGAASWNNNAPKAVRRVENVPFTVRSDFAGTSPSFVKPHMMMLGGNSVLNDALGLSGPNTGGTDWYLNYFTDSRARAIAAVDAPKFATVFDVAPAVVGNAATFKPENSPYTDYVATFSKVANNSKQLDATVQASMWQGHRITLNLKGKCTLVAQ